MRLAVIGVGLIGGSIGLAARVLGAEVTGYDADPATRELARAAGFRVAGAAAAAAAGVHCHAGHGLTYETVGAIAAMPEVSEVSIGHFLIGQSVFEGLPAVVRRFKALIAAERG